MIRLWLAIAGLGGISSVAVGALATHLADDAKAAELLRIGALYGIVHAAALIAASALPKGASRDGVRRSSPAGALPVASCCSAVACLSLR
jgi:uncharacterized membrane protein YgdD (TMEM256/DUF423 family)